MFKHTSQHILPDEHFLFSSLILHCSAPPICSDFLHIWFHCTSSKTRILQKPRGETCAGWGGCKKSYVERREWKILEKPGRRKRKRGQVKKVITGWETVSLQCVSRKAQSEQSDQRRNNIQPDFFFFFVTS